MSKPFKMRGPTFFKSAVKSYSPTKQGTALGAAQGGENIESTFGGAIGSGPTTGPVEDSADTQALAAQTLAEKRAATGGSGRKYQPGGGPGQGGVPMKSPAKQNKWAGMENPDHSPKPGAGDPGNPTLGTGSGDGQASATPKKSPNKQVAARPTNMTARAIGKHEAALRRAAGPLEKKSPTKKSPAKADPTWDEVKSKYDSYAAYKNMRKNAGLKANPNNPNA